MGWKFPIHHFLDDEFFGVNIKLPFFKKKFVPNYTIGPNISLPIPEYAKMPLFWMESPNQTNIPDFP